MSLIRLRPSPALVISLLALFVALSGVGYAATQIGTAQIKNGAVTAKKLHKNAVTKAKIKNNAVTKVKIKNGSVGTNKLIDLSVTTGKLADAAVTSDKLADQAVTTDKLADASVTTGKLADASVTGSKIGADAVGSAQLGTTQQAVSASVAIGAGGNAVAAIACPAGTQVLSGGGGASSFFVNAVESFQSGNGWIWVAHNYTGAAQTIFATAVCLNAAAPAAQPSSSHARFPAHRPAMPAR
jgi:hypothetical protein